MKAFKGAEVWFLRTLRRHTRIDARHEPADQEVFVIKFDRKLYLLQFNNGQFWLFWRRLRPVPFTKAHKNRNYTSETLDYCAYLKLSNVDDAPPQTNTWEQVRIAFGPRSFMICFEVGPDADLNGICTKDPTFFDACKKVSFSDLQVKDGIYIMALCGVFYVVAVRHKNFYLRSSNFVGNVPFNKDNLNDFTNYGLPTQDCNWFLTLLNQKNTPKDDSLLDEDLKSCKHLERMFDLNCEICSFLCDELDAEKALDTYDSERRYHLIRTHAGSMFIIEIYKEHILLVKTDGYRIIQKHNIIYIDHSNASWIYDNFLNGGLDEGWLVNQVNQVIKMYFELIFKLAVCALTVSNLAPQ
jgi:hypothetical protein